jgi:hypothetical protein
MNRPTFVTMSTLAFTVVAYLALTQTAHADAGLESRGWVPNTVDAGRHAPSHSSAHSGAPARR